MKMTPGKLAELKARVANHMADAEVGPLLAHIEVLETGIQTEYDNCEACEEELIAVKDRLVKAESQVTQVKDRLTLALHDGPRGEGWDDEINGLLMFLANQKADPQ